MAKPNNTKNKPSINNDDMQLDTPLLNNEENKYDIISNINNNINNNCDEKESKDDYPIVIKTGKLKYRGKWDIFGAKQYNAVLKELSEDDIMLYLTKKSDTTNIDDWDHEIYANPKHCVATKKGDTKTYFYIIQMSDNTSIEFEAENEDETLDWISKINQDDRTKLLLEYMTTITQYDALSQTIKSECDNCGFKKVLYKCSYKGCIKQKKKNVSECRNCYVTFHNGYNSRHKYDAQYMVKVDHSKHNAKLEKLIERMKWFAKEPRLQFGGIVMNSFLSADLYAHQGLWNFIPNAVRGTVLSAGAGLGVGALVVFSVQTIIDASLWFAGRISLEELRRRALRNLFTTLGVTIGTGAGVLTTVGITTVFGFIGGTAVPIIGHAVGIVVGLICSFILARWCKRKFDEWWPDDETQLKRDMFQDAIAAFGFDANDITDPKKFNLEILKKKYHTRAKEAHPDRHGGDHKKFIKLSEQYGILIAQYNKIHKNINEIIQDDIKKTMPPVSFSQDSLNKKYLSYLYGIDFN